MPFCQHLAFRRPVGRWSGVRLRPIRTASRTAPFADLLLVWGHRSNNHLRKSGWMVTDLTHAVVPMRVLRSMSNMTLIGGRRKVFLQFRQRIPALHRNRET